MSLCYNENNWRGLLMKLLHTADWHIGRTLNGYSLLDEQKYAFKQILQIAKDEKVDGIVIAGDIYDRAVPSPEAVTALNEMFKEINLENHFPIYAISGNHDSATRLNYGREWMQNTSFYLNTLLKEAFTPIETDDAQIFMLPFFDPLDARVYYQERVSDKESIKKLTSIGDAMNLVVSDMVKKFKTDKKHILITHFAVSAKKDEDIELTSETTSQVGGLATLTTDNFKDFDYVMMGHIHTRFASPSDTVRYSGSPVKFNVKEARMKNQGKGVDIVTIDNDGINREFKPLTPQTDLIVLEETWETLCDEEFYKKQPTHDAWFAITVKDFDRSQYTRVNTRAELEKRYGTVIELNYENLANTSEQNIQTTDITQISPEETVSKFFQTITNKPLSSRQKKLVDSVFNEVERENK